MFSVAKSCATFSVMSTKAGCQPAVIQYSLYIPPDINTECTRNHCWTFRENDTKREVWGPAMLLRATAMIHGVESQTAHSLKSLGQTEPEILARKFSRQRCTKPSTTLNTRPHLSPAATLNNHL